MVRKLFLTAVALLTVASVCVFAQENKARSGYKFETLADVKASPVKNQASTGTCWCFAGTSFLESELIRMGKPVYDLSEMFTVRNAYLEKAMRYFRFQGNTNFGQGGQGHDVMLMIDKYGMVPESAYNGLQYGSESHAHGEMAAGLQGYLESINKSRSLTPVWPEAYTAIVETYLGKAPEKFTYEGKEYTPKSFTTALGVNPKDYVELTSYQAYPFYQQVELEIPDNWTHSRYYNVPLNDLTETMQYALKNGYTIAWDGDCSEKGFNHGNGLAILPTDQPEDMSGTDRERWQKLSDAEKKDQMYSFVSPVPEMVVNDKNRQEAFDKRQTTDDHLMHLTGMLKDQNGTIYYKTKNSWGESRNPFGGYLYMSEPFCQMKTVSIMVHKDAIPKAIRAKLGL